MTNQKNDELKFDFDFGDASSDDLLNQAEKELLDRKGLMGGGDKGAPDEETQKAKAYFKALKSGKIEFPRASPTIFPLDADHFKQNNLPIPKNYDVLSAQAKFYWVEVPVHLIPGEKPFSKLQMSMEFGENISRANQIPKIHAAFPDKSFAEIATLKGRLDFGLGEDLQFKVAAGIDPIALPTSIPLIDANAGGKLAVDVNVASKLGIIAGPFSHTFKRAIVECRSASEHVLWTISDKQSLAEDNPVFIVILQVPKKVSRVQLTARMQAHRAAPLPQFFVDWLDNISPKWAEWLKKGSPLTLRAHSYNIST